MTAIADASPRSANHGPPCIARPARSPRAGPNLRTACLYPRTHVLKTRASRTSRLCRQYPSTPAHALLPPCRRRWPPAWHASARSFGRALPPGHSTNPPARHASAHASPEWSAVILLRLTLPPRRRHLRSATAFPHAGMRPDTALVCASRFFRRCGTALAPVSSLRSRHRRRSAQPRSPQVRCSRSSTLAPTQLSLLRRRTSTASTTRPRHSASCSRGARSASAASAPTTA
jgi:hypothetical protein